MSMKSIHLTESDHNAALAACQHPAATEDDKVFLAYVASMYVICESIRQDDYYHLQAILRRLEGVKPAGGNLPPVFHQHTGWALLICRDWKSAHEADTSHDWAYVAGLLDGINYTHQLDIESVDALILLGNVARYRMADAGREVQP